MKTIYNTDIWDIAEKNENSVVCITTNGVVMKNGDLVMGAGIALQTKLRFPTIPSYLGKLVRKYGNRSFNLGKYFINNTPIYLVSLPTKNNWKDKSDINLIKQSVKQLVEMVDKFKWNRIYLTPLGCSCGKLDWEDVSKEIECFLDDRFVVIIRNT